MVGWDGVGHSPPHPNPLECSETHSSLVTVICNYTLCDMYRLAFIYFLSNTCVLFQSSIIMACQE